MKKKKYQKGWNIFQLLIPVAAVLSASYAGEYVSRKTSNLLLTLLAMLFSFTVYFIPTIYFFIKRFARRKNNTDSKDT